MNRSTPPPHSQLWLIAGLTLGALLHFSYQPVWVLVLFISMAGWRLMRVIYNWPLPDKHHKKLKWLQHFLTLLAFALLLNSYGSLIGRDAGVGLLIVMLGLKLTEIRNYRDFYLACFLGYFLVVTNFFYSQDISTAILMFVDVILMTTALLSLNDNQQIFSTKQLFKLSSSILLQSIPLMMVLFIFFPRISGPLWGLPADAYTAKTGIDNKMTLGKISQLIQSDEVAFRVKFDGNLPPQSGLYWRGPVLWHTDGTTWTELEQTSVLSSPPKIISSGQAYHYTTTLEASNQSWLFALDFPEHPATDLNSYFSIDGQLLSKEKIKHRQQYTLTSHTQYLFNPEVDNNLKAALQLPENQHPRSRKLALEWKNQSHSTQELIQKALNFFINNNFIYTLSPPVLTGDKIDRFLFESRQGFCEHFAASFTVLMRAAGIPARIVTGYQGGEINPVDKYLVVRQRDAHAWTEVWFQNQGWIRIDPTSVVAKQRIAEGMNTIMPVTMRAPIIFSRSQTLLVLWQTLRNNWDAIDNKWNQWILAYGPKLQKEFLTQLGLSSPDWLSMTIYLFVTLNIVLLIISGFLFYQYHHDDPVVRIYQQFCDKIKKTGLIRQHNEGPVDFAHRIKQHYPALSGQIDRITELYIDLHYGQQISSIKHFKQAVKSFTPHPK